MSEHRAAREARFRALYADTYDHVLRFARRRTSPAGADDVVAEAFLVAWRRLDDVPTRPGEQLPWLYAVARNCLRQAQRTEQRQAALAVRIGETAGPAGTGPGSGLPSTAGLDIEAVAGRVDLDVAWQLLSAEEQEVLSLALWEDLPSPAAARVLGISSAAYRMRLSRARRSLRRHLTPTDLPASVPDARRSTLEKTP